MKSIWNNTFYNTQPALGWTFDISFDSYYLGDNNENGAGLYRLAKAAVDISIGKRESEYTSVYYAGVEFKKFTRAQNTGTFTIKFNEDKYYTITGILENIYNNDNLSQDYFKSGKHVYNNPTAGERLVTVKMYDPNNLHNNNNPVASYEFFNCRIMSIDDVPYSYESTESLTRSVTFVYDYMIYRDFRAEEQATQQAKEKREEIQQRVREKTYEGSVLGMVKANEQNWANATASIEEETVEGQNKIAYENRMRASNGYRGGGR